VFRNLGRNTFEGLVEAAGPDVAETHRSPADALLSISIVAWRPRHAHHQSKREPEPVTQRSQRKTKLHGGETGGSEVQPQRERGAGSVAHYGGKTPGAERLKSIQPLFLERSAPHFGLGNNTFGECGSALAERTCGELQTPFNPSTDRAARGCGVVPNRGWAKT